MEYETIKEIIDKFSLTSDIDKTNDIRRELVKKLSEIHPDRNDGKFKDDETKSLYNDIHSAINFIDENYINPTQLVPISKITDLIHLIHDIIPTKKNKTIDEFETELHTKFNLDLMKHLLKNKKPKIISTVISTILSTIWVFPSTINDHPILSQYISTNSSLFIAFWIISLILTSFIWLHFSIKERKIERAYDYLKLEENQIEMYCFFIHNGNIGDTFKRINFVNFIQIYDYKKWRLWNENSRFL